MNTAPTRRSIIPTIAAALLLLMGTACTPQTEPTATPTPTTTAPSTPPASPTPTVEPTPEPSPEPSPTEVYPSPPAGESEEQAAIREGWQNYRDVWDKFERDADLGDFTETQYVTTGQESIDVINRIRFYRDHNIVVTGERWFREVEVGEPQTNADGVRIAIVTSCHDPAGLTNVDASTGELSEFQAPHASEETVTMEQGADGVWRAAIYQNEGLEC